MDMPQGRPPEEVRRFEQAVRHACARASAVICPSFYTRRRLIDELGADPGRVMVNPWAADSSVNMMHEDQWRPVAARYGFDGPCVLHFGAADPRKNTIGVLEAWARLKPSVRDHWTLVVVGLSHSTLDEHQGFAVTRGIQKSVRLHGFAPEADVPALLNAADILAFPSLSEGFGLPILDAWATGTAVLTSNRTSLPEVAGDAAILVDPGDADAIAQGLRWLIEDQSLREGLIDFGTRRLRGYTWAHTAERFARVVEFAAGGTSLEHAAA
jgi:alpha-1,3-rhamnosyl/mannosyltransferase